MTLGRIFKCNNPSQWVIFSCNLEKYIVVSVVEKDSLSKEAKNTPKFVISALYQMTRLELDP